MLEAFNIKFQHVSGKTNIWRTCLVVWWTLTLTPDWIQKMQDGIWLYVFETLPKLSSEEIVPVCEVCREPMSSYQILTCRNPSHKLTSPLTNDQLEALQTQDEKCTSLIAMLRRGRLDPLVYSINDGILYRRVIEGGQTFQAIYVPRTPPDLISPY